MFRLMVEPSWGCVKKLKKTKLKTVVLYVQCETSASDSTVML